MIINNKKHKKMKKFLVVCAAVAMAVGCVRPYCTIEGNVANLADGTLTLTEPVRNGSVIDSAKVEQGKFIFKLPEGQPRQYALMSGHDHIAMVYAEQGVVKVTGDFSQDNGVQIGGTPSNDAYNVFNGEIYVLNRRYTQAASNEEREAIREEFDALIDQSIEANVNNPFGVDLLLQMKRSSLTAREMLQRLEQLSPEMQLLEAVVEAKDKATRKMQTEPQVEGSDIVPVYIDVIQNDANGNEVSLKSVVENSANKYVLLDFWASWCGPCMGEMPHLTAAYKKYHKKGFEIFGVSFDRNKEAWTNAIKNLNLAWVHVSSLNSFNNEAAEAYVVESIPTNFLIDCSNGVIVAKNLRGEEVEKKLAELFK